MRKFCPQRRNTANVIVVMMRQENGFRLPAVFGNGS
jgi:hypothetical protein